MRNSETTAGLNLFQQLTMSNTNDKATPLHFAVVSNNEAAIKMILKLISKNKKAPKLSQYVNPSDILGNTPLHFAVINK